MGAASADPAGLQVPRLDAAPRCLVLTGSLCWGTAGVRGVTLKSRAPGSLCSRQGAWCRDLVWGEPPVSFCLCGAHRVFKQLSGSRVALRSGRHPQISGVFERHQTQAGKAKRGIHGGRGHWGARLEAQHRLCILTVSGGGSGLTEEGGPQAAWLLLEGRMAGVLGLTRNPVTATQRTLLSSQRQPRGIPLQSQQPEPRSPGTKRSSYPPAVGWLPWERGPSQRSCAQSPLSMPGRSLQGVIWAGPDAESQGNEEKMQRVVTHWWPRVGRKPWCTHWGWGGGGEAGIRGHFSGKFWGIRWQDLEQRSRPCWRLQCPALTSCPSSPPTGQSEVPTQAAWTARFLSWACWAPHSLRGHPLGKMYFLDTDILICGVEMRRGIVTPRRVRSPRTGCCRAWRAEQQGRRSSWRQPRGGS